MHKVRKSIHNNSSRRQIIPCLTNNLNNVILKQNKEIAAKQKRLCSPVADTLSQQERSIGEIKR